MLLSDILAFRMISAALTNVFRSDAIIITANFINYLGIMLTIAVPRIASGMRTNEYVYLPPSTTSVA
jgi:hypothetical protein